MTFLFCAAFFKSYSACRRIQNSGVLPNKRETFRHITADRGFRSARMSCTIWRDTPRAFATAVTDKPTSGRMSSRMISPGCTGGNPFFPFIGNLLMVVFKVDINRVFAWPAERDAVVSGDAD